MAPCDVKCNVCGRCFRRESDKARHKCTAKRQKPVQEQEGAVEYSMCGHWLRSRGGLAVHRCARQEDGGQTFTSIMEDKNNNRETGSEITSERDYPDERSI